MHRKITYHHFLLNKMCAKYVDGCKTGIWDTSITLIQWRIPHFLSKLLMNYCSCSTGEKCTDGANALWWPLQVSLKFSQPFEHYTPNKWLTILYLTGDAKVQNVICSNTFLQWNSIPQLCIVAIHVFYGYSCWHK